MSVMLLLLQVVAAPETLFVTVTAQGADSSIVLTAVRQDSTVWLPAKELGGYLGVTIGPDWVTPSLLEQRFHIVVQWFPDQLAVFIQDPNQVLPVLVNRVRQSQASQLNRPVLSARSGLFGFVVGDDHSRKAYSVGYNFKGRVQVQSQQSTTTGNTTTVFANPVAGLWAAYMRTRMTSVVSLNANRGPAWASAYHSSLGNNLYAGALALLHGRLVVFGNSQQQYSVTIRESQLDVQVGVTQGHGAVRMGLGPTPVSPMSIPLVP